MYGGSYDGFLARIDHSTEQERMINVWPDNPMGHGAEGMKYRFQWNFPLLFSPHDPKRLYAGSNHLHVTTNEGQSWEMISPDLTRNDPKTLGSSGGPITQDNTAVEYYGTIFAISESPAEAGVIWTGSDDGLLHVTRDNGKMWTKVQPTGMPDWIQLNRTAAPPPPHRTPHAAAPPSPPAHLRPPLPPSRAAVRASPSLLLLLLLLLLRVRAPSRCPVQVPLGGCACGSSTALMAAAGPASAEEGSHGQHH